MPLTYAIALAALALAPEQPAPLSATADWTVNFAQKMCLAERTFGLADQPTILAIRSVPLSQSIEIRVSEVDPGYVSRTDDGSITLLPSMRTIPVKITSFGPITGGRRLTSFYLENVEVKDVVQASSVVIDRGRAGPPISVAPGGAESVVASMTSCGDGLLRQWGIDPVAMHKLSRQPKAIGGSEAEWFKPKDYPKAARGNFRFGRTMALIAIGIDGRVTNCNIAESAGNPDLDSRTCAILAERGRYDPGLDVGGKPVPSQKLVSVRWTLWSFSRR